MCLNACHPTSGCCCCCWGSPRFCSFLLHVFLSAHMLLQGFESIWESSTVQICCLGCQIVEDFVFCMSRHKQEKWETRFFFMSSCCCRSCSEWHHFCTLFGSTSAKEIWLQIAVNVAAFSSWDTTGRTLRQPYQTFTTIPRRSVYLPSLLIKRTDYSLTVHHNMVPNPLSITMASLLTTMSA